jgi:hypothetical protein
MTRRRLATCVAAVALAVGSLAASSGPAAAWDLTDPVFDEPAWNEYSTPDLPAFIVAPTPFTVVVTGPVPVCAMDYDGATRTAPPWQFVANPFDGNWSSQVTISLCDGGTDISSAWASPAFEFSSTVLASGRRAGGVPVFNAMPDPATAVVVDRRGRQVGRATTVPPEANARVRVKVRGVRRTMRYTLRVSAAGLSMERPVIVAHGWTTMFSGGGQDPATYGQCQRVTWSYRTAKAPGGASSASVLRDIRGALRLLSRYTNLTFTRADAGARLRFSWRNLGSPGPSGQGGTDGRVVLNNRDPWGTDRYAGFGNRFGSPAGRGWLITHEVMHTMGFGHSDNPDAVMAPVNRGQHAFTRDEIDGLKALYPAGACSG